MNRVFGLGILVFAKPKTKDPRPKTNEQNLWDLQLQPFTPDQNLTKRQAPSLFRSIKHQPTHRTRSVKTKATNTRARKTRHARQSKETSPHSKADASVTHSPPAWQRSTRR